MTLFNVYITLIFTYSMWHTRSPAWYT